ncbi:hypothetical protein ACED44_09680 [Vibrio splendidus]|uniref:hypothetical protein n=1 Tax=Vibrio splendidus TaxID=29497 RepID=UPI00352BD739
MAETKNNIDMFLGKCSDLLDAINSLESEMLSHNKTSLPPELKKVRDLVRNFIHSSNSTRRELTLSLIKIKDKVKLEVSKLPINTTDTHVVLEFMDESTSMYEALPGIKLDHLQAYGLNYNSIEDLKEFEKLYAQLSQASNTLPNSKSLKRITGLLYNLMVITDREEHAKTKENIISVIESALSSGVGIPKELSSIYEDVYTTVNQSLNKDLRKYRSTFEEEKNHIDKFNFEYNKSLNTMKSRVDEGLSSISSTYQKSNLKIQEQFNSQSEQIRSMTAESIDDIDNQKANAKKELLDTVDTEINGIKKRIDEEVIQFEAKRKYMDQLLESVGLATNVDVTIRQADKEEKMANDLRQKGIFLMYASVVLLVILFSGFVGIDLIADSGKTFSNLTLDIAFSRGLLPITLLLVGFALFKLNEQPIDDQDRKLTVHTVGLYLMMLSLPIFILQFIEFTGTALFADIKPTNKPEPEDFVFRFMTVLLVSSPALYMLKESASHRAKENLYRQRGTQLVSISGYLSDLPDAPRAEVKQRLADNFFSFHDKKADTSNVPDFLKNMNDAVKLAKQVNAEQNPQPQEPRSQKSQG